MALGSWRGLKTGQRPEPPLARLGWVAVGSAVALIAAMAAMAKAENAPAHFLGSQILFPALAAMAGMLGGWQFPVASRVYFRRPDEAGGVGALYAWDLAGACAGALLIGVWLIPVYGFFKTAVLITVLNLPPALLACWWARRSRSRPCDT
jgi:predicted membrane-bound spermidine synthase